MPRVGGIGGLNPNAKWGAGTPGHSGPPGPPGYDGEDGLEGLSGTSGKDGQPGPIGLTGNVGRIGPSGLDGSDGDDGFPGNPGQQGSVGVAGPQGNPGGIVGQVVVTGPPGYDGNDGDDGFPGVPGPMGPAGTGGGGGGSGALILLEQYTAANSATLDFTTCITSTYDDYLVEMLNVLPVTDSVGLQMVASTDGGSTWLGGTNYAFLMNRTGGSQTSGAASSIPVDGYASALAGNTAAYGGVSGSIKLFNPLSATAYKYMTVNDAYRAYDGTFEMITGIAGIWTTTAVNALRFKFSSGNIASGTIRVYGIAKI
jgi:Collagen triple helix repeat (20 copies)